MSLPGILGGERRRYLPPLFLLVLGQLVAAVASVWLVRAAFDHALASDSSTGSDLAALAAGLVASVALGAELRRRERIVAESFGQDYVSAVRQALFERALRIDPVHLSDARRGGILLRFLGDLAPLKHWVALGLVRLPVAALTAVAGIVGLATSSPRIASVVSAALLLGALAGLLLGQRLHPALVGQRRARSRLATNVAEKIGAVASIRAHGREQRELARVARHGERLAAESVRRVRVEESLRAAVEGATGLATVAALLVGAREVMAGRATAGAVVAATALVGLVTPSLRDLCRIFEVAQGVRLTRARLASLFRLPVLPVSCGDPAPRLAPGLALSRLRLGAVELSRSLPPGTLVALGGEGVAEWSELARILAGTQLPRSGDALWRGRRLVTLEPALRARSVSVVSAELTLVSGSLSKNLRYRVPRPTAADLEQVLQCTGLLDLPGLRQQGLRTRVSVNGSNLSSSERVCLSIARGLLGEPAVLFVAEPLRSFDEATRRRLWAHLRARAGITFVVTDDEALFTLVDEVWRITGQQLAVEHVARKLPLSVSTRP